MRESLSPRPLVLPRVAIATSTRTADEMKGMTMKKVFRSTVLCLVVVSGSLMVSPAQAAPECRGIVQCWPERVRECISNLALPPRPC
jgi:hypothetical protein